MCIRTATNKIFMRRSNSILFLLMLLLLSCSKDNNSEKENRYPEPSGNLTINFLNNQLTMDLKTKTIQSDDTKSYNQVAESQESLFIVDRANNALRAYNKTNMGQQWAYSPEPGVNEEIRFANSKAHYDIQTNSVYIHFRIVNLTTFGSTYKTVKLSATTGTPQMTLSPDRETHYHTTIGNNYFYLDRMGTDNSTWRLNKRNSIMLVNHESTALNRFPHYLTTHNQSLIVVFANGDIVAYNDALTEIWDLQTGGTNNSYVTRSNDRLYVTSRNNKMTEVNLITGESGFIADTDFERAIPVGADAQGVYLLDAEANGITIKKHNSNGTSAWKTTLDTNLTSNDSFNMKGVVLTNHLLVVVASESSGETHTSDIFLIQKNNGSEIWKKSSASLSSSINNLLVNTDNSFFFTN
jgi:hypothetical protein